MRVRRETVEHPFGTMKARMGATHFLTKTLPKVAAEMALSVLAYNLTRAMNIVGTKPLRLAKLVYHVSTFQHPIQSGRFGKCRREQRLSGMAASASTSEVHVGRIDLISVIGHPRARG